VSVLLLCLAGPLQSWGVASRHNTRDSLPFPTKSGVVGLLANALGRRRTDPVDDLAALRLGVRIDQPGERIVDFHTVSGASHAPLETARQRLPNAGGGRLSVSDSTKITRRIYLADAVFVAGLEGDEPTVETLARAVSRPCRPLFLGRRSCPPARPVLLDVRRDVDLKAALTEASWQASRSYRRRVPHPAELPLVLEDPDGDEVLLDQPLSFQHSKRRYAARNVRYLRIPIGPAEPVSNDSHDPFTLLI